MEGKQFGFILISKPSGPTSHNIVNDLRKITGIKKIGHAGTLDPLASGCLLVGIGREATRQLDKFLKLDKEYVAQINLSLNTDTILDPWSRKKGITLFLENRMTSA